MPLPLVPSSLCIWAPGSLCITVQSTFRIPVPCTLCIPVPSGFCTHVPSILCIPVQSTFPVPGTLCIPAPGIPTIILSCYMQMSEALQAAATTSATASAGPRPGPLEWVPIHSPAQAGGRMRAGWPVDHKVSGGHASPSQATPMDGWRVLARQDWRWHHVTALLDPTWHCTLHLTSPSYLQVSISPPALHFRYHCCMQHPVPPRAKNDPMVTSHDNASSTIHWRNYYLQL